MGKAACVIQLRLRRHIAEEAQSSADARSLECRVRSADRLAFAPNAIEDAAKEPHSDLSGFRSKSSVSPWGTLRALHDARRPGRHDLDLDSPVPFHSLTV